MPRSYTRNWPKPSVCTRKRRTRRPRRRAPPSRSCRRNSADLAAARQRLLRIGSRRPRRWCAQIADSHSEGDAACDTGSANWPLGQPGLDERVGRDGCAAASAGERPTGRRRSGWHPPAAAAHRAAGTARGRGHALARLVLGVHHHRDIPTARAPTAPRWAAHGIFLQEVLGVVGQRHQRRPSISAFFRAASCSRRTRRWISRWWSWAVDR